MRKAVDVARTLLVLSSLAAGSARAAPVSDATGAVAATDTPGSRVDPAARLPGDVELMVTSFVGDGLRFNNPYRLATPLGASAESVSRTATYGDFGFAVVGGDPSGIRSGAALRLSMAIEGVPQSVMTPSYLAWRRWRHWAAYGRVGTPLVLTPSLTWGLEASAGAVWLVRGGIGIATELVGDLFYGAGTREAATPAYPVLSAQLGLILDYEVLP